MPGAMDSDGRDLIDRGCVGVGGHGREWAPGRTAFCQNFTASDETKTSQRRAVRCFHLVRPVVLPWCGCGGPVFFGAGNSTGSRARFPHHVHTPRETSHRFFLPVQSTLSSSPEILTTHTLGSQSPKTRLVELPVPVMTVCLPQIYHFDYRPPISKLA